MSNENASIANRIRFALQTANTRIQSKHHVKELKLYAFQLSDNLERIIYNFSSEFDDIVYDEFMDSFDAMYNTNLANISHMINQNELKLSDYVLDVSGGKPSTVPSDLKQLIRITWTTKKDNDDDDKCNVECDDMFSCKPIGRISYLMELYEKHYLGRVQAGKDPDPTLFIDIFGGCMESYKIPNLMNDFMHCCDKHGNQDALDTLNKGYLIKLCKRKECISEKYRDDNNDIGMQMDDLNDAVLMSYFQLLHSYFCHQNGTGINTIRHKLKKRFSKFQTVIDVTDITVDIDDVKEVDTNDAQPPPIPNNDDHAPDPIKLDEFSFGHKFFYWSHFSQYNDLYIAKPKHDSLRQELLDNTICPIEKRVFSKLLIESSQSIQCTKAKHIRAWPRGTNNLHYEIPENLPLTIPHMMVLKLYTNDSTLQFKFKKHGTRKIAQSDSVKNIKDRNTEIAHWFRLLYESVLMFGAETKRTDTFYHGVSVPLLFDQLSPRFNAPISTTVTRSVALRFGENGIVVALKPNRSRPDMYFDVRWLSAFPQEDERLIVDASNLDIANIREYRDTTVNNTKYVSAIRLLDEISKAYFVMFSSEKRKEVTEMILCRLLNQVIDVIATNLIEASLSSLDTNKLLIFILQNGYDSDAVRNDIELYKSSGDSRIYSYLQQNLKQENSVLSGYMGCIEEAARETPIYILQVLNHVIATKANSNNELFVIKSDFDELNPKLKAELFTLNDGKLSSRMYPNNQIAFIHEFVWIIDADAMRKLKRMRRKKIGIPFEGNEYIYSFSSTQQLRFVPDITGAEVDWPQHTGFGIEVKSLPHGITSLNAFLSVKFEGLGFCINGKTQILKPNGYMGYKAFRNNLLDKIECLTIRIALNFKLITDPNQ
eukprot:63903_1